MVSHDSLIYIEYQKKIILETIKELFWNVAIDNLLSKLYLKNFEKNYAINMYFTH